MANLSGKIVVITGAAGNLGRALAQVVQESGATRVLFDRSHDSLAKIYGENSARTQLVGNADLTDETSVNSAVAAVLKHHGRIDALGHTVGGFAGGKKVHEDDLANWELMYRMNVHTTLLMCRAVVPVMLKQGAGAIVTVGARAALAGVPGLAAYCASKSAVIRLTESLAQELKDSGITANGVLPGTIDTPQNRRDMPNADFSKWVAPTAIANVMAFLMSGEASVVSGAFVPVYGRS